MVQRTFPFRLHALLDQTYDLDIDGESDIISWTPSGKTFKIHNVEAFKSKILPKYFPKQSQYKSFKRQLQYYGFSNFGWEHFGHPYFLRRQRELVAHLRHKKTARNQVILAEPSCPTPPTHPLTASLNDSERQKKATDLPLNREARIQPPSLSVTAQLGADPVKLQQELSTLACNSNIYALLNQQRLLDLMLTTSMPPSLALRSAAGAQNLNLFTNNNNHRHQQIDSQDLLCRSNRLAEWQLRLALSNSGQLSGMLL
ncbi:unnamed protein product [Cylindrotheca closterium]|uniref:HSF-type DNA-binding domain-containing protein n=1 Tax=Cylindrotheca closterium TaxID=2856 RepID=A0AAD2PW99_9STRA|nr:unnamed protein product [Cylindrotheca closterium]